jgi:hypothetical protein
VRIAIPGTAEADETPDAAREFFLVYTTDDF